MPAGHIRYSRGDGEVETYSLSAHTPRIVAPRSSPACGARAHPSRYQTGLEPFALSDRIGAFLSLSLSHSGCANRAHLGRALCTRLAHPSHRPVTSLRSRAAIRVDAQPGSIRHPSQYAIRVNKPSESTSHPSPTRCHSAQRRLQYSRHRSAGPGQSLGPFLHLVRVRIRP